MLNADPQAITDPARLDKLRRLRLLDTPAEPAFDRLTRLAARMMKTPIALVVLIDDSRKFFKSQVGLQEIWPSIQEAPYSRTVVATRSPLLIGDTRSSPLAVSSGASWESGVIAYAGVPLITSDGFALGALCVIDTRPRQWADEDVSLLDDLAQSVMTEIELRGTLIEHEQIEEALRKSEQRLQAVITSAPVIVYVIDRDGIILMTEGKGLEAINVRPNRLVGQSIFDVYTDKDITQNVRRALAGESVTLLTEQETPVGPLHYEVRISPLYNTREEIVGAIGVVNDVSERIWVEQTLESTIQRLTLLRRIEVELAESLDLESVLTIAMDTAQRASHAEHGFIGLIEGDVLRVVYAVGDYVKGQTWEFSNGVMGRALRTREPQFAQNVENDPDFVRDMPGIRAQMTIPLIHRDHLIGALNLKTNKPEVFTPEAFDFLALVAGPITVAIDNAQLYQVSRQQLDELHELYMRVSDLEQLKTDMIRIAAHDLRNPLGIVKGYAEFLLMEDGDPLTEEQRSFVMLIESAGQKMFKIINDILSLQRVEAAQNGGGCEQINLSDLAHDVFKSNEVRAREKQQEYELTLPDEEVPVCIDVAQIREAMENLISNAIKYTPKNGAVMVELELDVDRIVFEVEDNGYGVPDDQQARLFQPFFRASNARSSEIEGTGLGLHLVKNIIERHGGRMRFHSVLGGGSTFGFELPLMG